jgi:hypothetical protein
MGAPMKLENGLIYAGNYQFQQVGYPVASVSRSGGGTARVSVKFAGAAPLAKEFIKNLRGGGIPDILDNGSLGKYSAKNVLVRIYEGFDIDDGRAFSTITLNFLVPAQDLTTEGREATSTHEFSIQTVRVTGPTFNGDQSYYEATYYAPTVTHRWISGGKAGPNSTGPSGEIKIIREVLHVAYGTPEDPSAGADLTPEQETRILNHVSEEVVAGQQWQNTTTVALVLVDDDRS